MRTLCDVCECAAAVLFCAADEAALCRACDDKVHLCNKLASRHVRVVLDNPVDVPRCDICENLPAFFYCEVDGSSLCQQCDTAVHVDGKRTHRRYLLLRQRVKLPGDKPGLPGEPALQSLDSRKQRVEEDELNHMTASAGRAKEMESGMIDLNTMPHRLHGQASNYQPD